MLLNLCVESAIETEECINPCGWSWRSWVSCSAVSGCRWRWSVHKQCYYADSFTNTTLLGTLGIVDHDRVEISNLQRQILHTDDRVGWLKADSAKVAIQKLKEFLSSLMHHANPANIASRIVLELIPT